MRHTMKALGIALLAVACSSGNGGSSRLDATASRAGGPGGGGGGEEEEAGNNLAVPVIWPEGVTLALQGTMLQANLSGASMNVDGTDWYLQKDPNNTWQAENLALIPGEDEPLVVNTVDWGDNLESGAAANAGVVHVEVALYRTLDTSMQGFTMLKLSGQGMDEVWGSDGTLYDATEAMVYSPAARLTIQKFLQPPAVAHAVWNAQTGQWDGDLKAPCGGGMAWEPVEGSGAFAAEINVAGKIVYGYNWTFTHQNPEPGTWRITFALDGTNYPGTLNTMFDASTVILASEEGEEGEDDGGTASGGVAYVVPELNLTYIDVPIGIATYPPKAIADAFTTPEDDVLKVAAPGVLGNDSDGDSTTITAELVSGVAHGTLLLHPDGSFDYTPDANFFGSDSFAYKASDGSLYSETVMVALSVSPVNDPPTTPVTLSPVAGERIGNGEVVFSWMPATDVEGDSLRYALEVLENGTVIRRISTPDLTAALTAEERLPAGTYAWHVRAQDLALSGDFSPLVTFQVTKKSSGWGFCSVSGTGGATAATVIPLLGLALAVGTASLLLRRDG